MKNLLYILCLSALVLAGCQKDETLNSQNSKGVTVKYSVVPTQIAQTKAAVDTKGTLVNTTGDDDKTLETFADIVGSFVAKAYNDGGVEKVFQTVTWDESSSAWVGSPVAYWPQATSLDFLAYANLPDSQTATIASTGVSTEHAVPATATAQKDILFGHYQGKGGNTGTAEIRFEHPLTAVRFLRGEIDDELVIKSISIEGVAESGTATMTPGGVISWSDVDSHDYTVSQSDNSGLRVDAVSGLIGEPFIIIPQKLADHRVSVTVTFKDGTEVAATISSGEWKAGYTNTYTLSYNQTLTVWGYPTETEEENDID